MNNFIAAVIVRLLLEKTSSRAVCFHEDLRKSIEIQQYLIWDNLPQEFRQTIRTRVAYISYNEKYGFADGSFAQTNRSLCPFMNYERGAEILEGQSPDIIWCAGEVPLDFLELSQIRVSPQIGSVILTPNRGI